VPTPSVPARSLQAAELFHPLLARPVANSLRVHGSSVLVTGSNMAGKTTFMRTLGVNAVLARTLHTVCAREWVAPPYRVRTSIGRADSLLEGKSHYLAEVESVHSLLRAKGPGRQHLFLLDEMFRGTNTAERVAAAYAVLAYLARGVDLVVVATHDLELVGLLGDTFDAYHFRERIADDTLSFDYTIRPGVSSTRNAIALLELKSYPEDVVADAIRVLNRSQALDATNV
jgi:DNA mismatch repair ATPase MutS